MKRLVMLMIGIVAVAWIAMCPFAHAESAMVYFGCDLSRDTFPDTLKAAAREALNPTSIERASVDPVSPLDPGEAPPWPGNLDMNFRLFEESVGGENVWQESWSGVPVDENGVFHVLLGSHEDLDLALFGPKGYLYLTVTVEGDQYGGRRRIMEPQLDSWLTPLSGNTPDDVALALVETLNALGNGAISPEMANSVDALVKTLMSSRLANALRGPIRTPPGR
ncbi:MAG: hypothetical protein AB1752_10800 [Candidatus Zixiibacteriota bacterium]